MHETILHGCSPNRQTASPTCMLICFLNLPFIFCMHYLLLLLSLSVAMHFIDLLTFSFQLTIGANLGLVSAFTKATLHNLEKEGSPSSPNLRILAQHWPPRLNCTFLEVSGYLALKFVQIFPWFSSPSQLGFLIAQSQQPTSQLDCALRSSRSQLVSQQPGLALYSLGSQSPDLPTFMIIHPGMLQVSSHVHSSFQLTFFLLWVFPCLHLS